MTRAIKVLIADDHAVVREGLRTFITTEAGMDVIGEAEDGRRAVELVNALRPDVILLDMVMPHCDGLSVISAIRRSQAPVKILILTSFDDDDKLFPAIKAGADGYLLKNTSPKRLLEAIRDVYHGEPSISPVVAQKLMSDLQHQDSHLPEDCLTRREREVLTCLAKGLSNQDIASALFVCEGTVRSHVSNILNKLHLANRTQAALYALREGLASVEDSSGL